MIDRKSFFLKVLKIHFSAHSEDLKPRSPALNEVMMMVDDDPNTTGWVGGFTHVHILI